eukprot:COSAG05_NODE_25028_length_198_cov_58.747475_1_plen_33_part_10
MYSNLASAIPCGTVWYEHNYDSTMHAADDTVRR